MNRWRVFSCLSHVLVFSLLLSVALFIVYAFWLFDSLIPHISFWKQHYLLLANLIIWGAPLVILCLLPLGIMRLLSVPWSQDTPWSEDQELVSGLHRNSAYLFRRAALASATDTSGSCEQEPGATDNCPVLAQSCRTRSVLITILRAPMRSACKVERQLTQQNNKPLFGRLASSICPGCRCFWRSAFCCILGSAC